MLEKSKVAKQLWLSLSVGVGGGLFTTSSIRAGVYSVSALNREIIRKPDPYHSLIKTNGAEKKGRQISN